MANTSRRPARAASGEPAKRASGVPAKRASGVPAKRASGNAGKVPGARANRRAGNIGADIARYYDLDLSDDPGDVAMYLTLAAESGGRVLELCAGSGRISVPLAAAGHAVTAVDRDPDMLARARSTWKRHPAREAGGGSLTLIEHDVTLLDLRQHFDLVILPLSSLLLIDGRAAQQAALNMVARHLAATGHAVIDVWLPDAADLELYDGRVVLEWVRLDEERDEWVAKLVSARHDPSSDTSEITTLFDAWTDTGTVRRAMRQDTASLLTDKELDRLASKAALTVERRFGDYDMTPFGSTSDRLVVVYRGGRSYGGRAVAG